jgi:hypothetical protein
MHKAVGGIESTFSHHGDLAGARARAIAEASQVAVRPGESGGPSSEVMSVPRLWRADQVRCDAQWVALKPKVPSEEVSRCRPEA